MAERNGKILSYNPTNRQGLIQPAEGGPPALFYLPSVANPEPAPKANDVVTFEAPEVRKNKQGKAVQGNASSVTITERAPEAPAPTRGSERRELLTSPYPRRKDAKPRRGEKGGRGERRGGRTGERGSERRDEARAPREGGERRFGRREAGGRREGASETRERAPRRARSGQRPERQARGGAQQKTGRGSQPKTQRKLETPPFAFPLCQEIPATVARARGFHPGLLLNNFIAWPLPDKENRWHLRERHKRFFFEKVFEGSYRSYQTQTLPWDALRKRWDALLQSYEERGLSRVTLRLSSRLSLNLHTPSVLGHGGLRLDRSWGYPVIPASAIKGAVHAYAASSQLNRPEVDLSKEELVRAFGSRGQIGEITFFDGVPVRRIGRIALESMNCTVPSYYSGEAPPTDNQDPTSTPFLAIEPGADFLFAISGPAPLRDKLSVLLKECLMCTGIGAKTSVGFGRFEEPRERPVTQRAPKTEEQPGEAEAEPSQPASEG